MTSEQRLFELRRAAREGQKAQLPNGWVEGSKELFHK